MRTREVEIAAPTVGVVGGKVWLAFDRAVCWLRLDPHQALALAESLRRGALDAMQQGPAPAEDAAELAAREVGGMPDEDFAERCRRLAGGGTA